MSIEVLYVFCQHCRRAKTPDAPWGTVEDLAVSLLKTHGHTLSHLPLTLGTADVDEQAAILSRILERVYPFYKIEIIIRRQFPKVAFITVR